MCTLPIHTHGMLELLHSEGENAFPWRRGLRGATYHFCRSYQASEDSSQAVAGYEQSPRFGRNIEETF